MKRLLREKYLIISDVHVPDQDNKILDKMYKFIKYYKPDSLILLGDFLNFTKVSSFAQDPEYTARLSDELDLGGKILHKLRKVLLESNPGASMTYFEGNHESRLQRYLIKNAEQLADVKINGEKVMTVPHLLGLKSLGIKWVPSLEVKTIHGVSFLHGDKVRSKSGYAAHANIDRFGTSGFTGHTHRLAHVSKTQSNKTKFWIETGCLCNLNPTPAYTAFPDWAQGFAVAEYDRRTKQFYPTLIPIQDSCFLFNSRVF